MEVIQYSSRLHLSQDNGRAAQNVLKDEFIHVGNVCVCMYVCVCVYVRMHVCIDDVCMYECMYLCTCIYASM